MDALSSFLRLTGVEMLKFWGKPVARAVLGLMLIGPAAGEGFLLLTDAESAVFPKVTTLMFIGEVLLLFTLSTVVVAVLALGNDYELGTVRALLSRGVPRHQFLLAKIAATVIAALANGLAYMTSGVLAASLAHLAYSDMPLAEAAGANLVWRALGVVMVLGLTGFVAAGVVMLALVLGRSAWIGMLAGLGGFLGDFFVGGLRLVQTTAYRYTMSYHALSLLERYFPSDPTLRMSVTGSASDWTSPGRAIAILLLYGCALTLAAILLFRRQDLTAKV
jgi:ABC-type transport system involved in multi-copper enzyme maturation permease subunit